MWWVSIVRTVALYSLLIFGLRIMGKRQISQLQTSELVVTLFISELAVLPVQELRRPVWEGVLPVIIMIICEIGISTFMLKSGKFRQVVCGKPTVIIENGRILQKNMRKLRMSTEDLFEQLRQNDVFYLKDVAFAIIETNGTMSVLKHPEHDFLTPRLMDIHPKSEGLEVVVVSDGEISRNSLKLCNRDEEWLSNVLKKEKTSLKDVFIMTAKVSGQYQIIKKDSGS